MEILKDLIHLVVIHIRGDKMAKYSEKQNKWTQEYIKKAYDDIKVRVPKGKREEYKKLADQKGKSLNQLIIELLDDYMTK